METETAAAGRSPSEPDSLSASRRTVRAFGEVVAALNDAQDSDALLRLIGRHLCELVGVVRCSVYLREPDSPLFRGQVGWNRSWQGRSWDESDARIKRLVAGTKRDAFTREIVETRGPVVVADALSDPRPVHAAMRAWDVRSMLGVPMVLGGEVIGIVFLDDAEQQHGFTPAETELASMFADLAAVAISQAEMTTRLRQSLKMVAKQNELLQHAAEMDETLTSLVLMGGNLAEIAQAVAELTGKPCEIYDAEHRRLATGPPGDAADTRWRPLDRAARDHPDIRDALDSLGARESGVIGPFAAAGFEHRYLVVPIVSRDEVWGSLAIVEHDRPFGALDAHIARRAATNVALELVAERRAANAEWDARASLAGELIRGASDLTGVTRRAEYLGIDLGARHVVCIIGTQGKAMLPSIAHVARAFAARAPGGGVLVASVAEGMVVIARLDEREAESDLVRAARDMAEGALEEIGEQRPVLIAIGPSCTSAECYARAYEEARQVMSCLKNFAQGERSLVLATDDLGPGRLFLAASTPAEADRFVHDALGALVSSDDAALADVLETLEVFFESSRSVRRAAERLGVHENTIRYRLARIKELTGLAIGSDANDELTAHLALLILRMQRLAQGRGRPLRG